MAFFGLFGKKSPEPNEKDYTRVAVPDPHQPDGKAPYIDAWTGYAPVRMLVSPSQLHTIGREPDQVSGPYPSGEMTVVEDPEWKVQPPAVQSVRRYAPNPNWTENQKPAIRPQRVPSSYRVTNPFDWQLARRLNGFHFSMADHIRAYPIGGMLPMTSRRNTFRLMPPPHDVNQTNVPGNTAFDVSDMDMASPVSSWRSPLARLR